MIPSALHLMPLAQRSLIQPIANAAWRSGSRSLWQRSSSDSDSLEMLLESQVPELSNLVLQPTAFGVG